MEYNEGLGDTSIDGAFNFNDYTKEEKKKKRSSILKQSKYANIDLYDDEETVTGPHRKSLRMKRVSFAETFQVKEMHTGNIYDIPGFNESNASITSHRTNPENDSTGENFSTSEGMKWHVHSLSEERAVFVLKWRAYVYECALRVEVETVNASECSVSFRPVGTHLNYPNKEYVMFDNQVRGYKYFNHLVKDTVFPFSIYSDSIIDKLSEYSAITKQVELLMLDLLKCSITGIYEVSNELDPLKLYCRIVNDYYECVYDVTFPINIKNYPCGKIVPEVKHIYCRDITEGVRKALFEVEPGKDYLYRMIDAARDVKP